MSQLIVFPVVYAGRMSLHYFTNHQYLQVWHLVSSSVNNLISSHHKAEGHPPTTNQTSCSPAKRIPVAPSLTSPLLQLQGSHHEHDLASRTSCLVSYNTSHTVGNFAAGPRFCQ